MFIILLFIFEIVFAFICASMARHRNREPVLWGVLGFFFGIFAVLVLAAIGRNNDGMAQAAVIAAPAASPLDEIRKLKTLMDEGVLTAEEFNAQKQRLLAKDA